MGTNDRWILDWVAFGCSLLIGTTIVSAVTMDNFTQIEANTRFRMACVEAKAKGVELDTCKYNQLKGE